MGGKIRRTTTINPSGDTYLYSAAATTNYSTDAALQVRDVSANQRNPIIKFDVSSLIGTKIVSAKLKLYLSAQSFANVTISAYNILVANADMVFAEMTWNVKKTGTAWAGAAGCMTADTDYNSVAIGAISVVNLAAAGTMYEMNLTPAAINGWLSDNYGMTLRSSSTTDLTVFHSKETLTTAMKPALELVYLQ